MFGHTKKIVRIVAVVLIVLMCIPMLQASSNRKQNVLGEKPCSANVGRPDLAFQKIGFYTIYGDHGLEVYAYANVVNNGNESAYGIDVLYSVNRLPFMRTVSTDTIHVSDGLPPGGSVFLCLTYSRYLPKIGVFRMTCEVNPERTINESTYDNNILARNFLDLFGFWFPSDQG